MISKQVTDLVIVVAGDSNCESLTLPPSAGEAPCVATGRPRPLDVSRVPHSLATSSLQLEPPRALPFMGRAGAGSRVCTERV